MSHLQSNLQCHCTVTAGDYTNNMKPDVEIFFKDPSQQLKKLTQVLDFQKSHRERLNKRLLQQTEITSPNSNKIMERLKELKNYEFQSQLKASNIIDVESLPYSLASNGASEYQQVPLKKLIFAYPFKDGRTSSGKIMFNRKMQIHWFDHLLTNIQLQSGQSKFNPQVQDAISEDGILNLNL
ncbi:hypothetical protein GQR58_019717 [Nymphon striatum]|nr:hypothetical protein GQR58_019717 [Nymphon striatum]